MSSQERNEMPPWNHMSWAALLSGALLTSALPSDAAPAGAPARGQGSRQVNVQRARSYDAVEADLISNMRRLLELRGEISRLKIEAAQKDREVAEAKSSLNVITRIMLARRLEEYHALLKTIDEREAEERRLSERVHGLADDAYAALRSEGETGEKRARLGVISGRELERITRELESATQRQARADNPAEKIDLSREIERLEAECARARRELHQFYSLPLN
jgi:hypothetical protein